LLDDVLDLVRDQLDVVIAEAEPHDRGQPAVDGRHLCEGARALDHLLPECDRAQPRAGEPLALLPEGRRSPQHRVDDWLKGTGVERDGGDGTLDGGTVGGCIGADNAGDVSIEGERNNLRRVGRHACPTVHLREDRDAQDNSEQCCSDDESFRSRPPAHACKTVQHAKRFVAHMRNYAERGSWLTDVAARLGVPTAVSTK
jgi:hypothetical protein